MMKRFFTCFIVSAVAFVSYSQLPKWIIPAINDSLFIKLDNRIIQGVGEGKTSIWTMDGRQLYSTDNEIMPFKEGIAAIKAKGKQVIIGFIDLTGKFTPLPNVHIAYDNPYFDGDLLLGEDNGKLTYYKTDGTKATFPAFVKTYPFNHGYAPFFTYENIEKKKNPHYGYFKEDGSEIKYTIWDSKNIRTIDPKDIQFASGIGPDMKGVAVIKDKLYWFDCKNEWFEPFEWKEDDSEKMRQLSLDGDYESYFLNLPDNGVNFIAKYGKGQTAKLAFDKCLRPYLFLFPGKDISFDENKETEANYKSMLSSYGLVGNYGLSLYDKEILPQQFDEIGTKYGNRAFVKINDKWGVIEILPDLSYSLKINKGEDVAFRHQKFETQIRLDLPKEVSAKNVRIDIPENTGCVIDKTSRVSKDTESGNYVTYNCALNIPSSLPDTITSITYSPVTISYDGVSLFLVPISVRAWHLKHYNVDPIESETSISNGVATFTLNINTQKIAGESDYPFEVKIDADSISVEYEKLSETRYKCFVSNLQEGNNNLNIYVTEKGCPSSIFPFEIVYSKPVPKKKQKEEVVIRKKDPVAKKRTPRLEL